MGQIGDFFMNGSIAGGPDAGARPRPATPGLEPGLGGLDILVHCVGASFPKPGGALALTDED
jgi:hypothetical protein